MWYLSVTLLVIMVTFLTIRCLLFFFAWIAGYEFWVLPRLFDETLAFAESFTPVIGHTCFVRLSLPLLFLLLGVVGCGVMPPLLPRADPNPAEGIFKM